MTDPVEPPSYLQQPAENPAVSAEGRVRFVSRSTPRASHACPPLADADGRPLPGLGDGAVRLLLLLVLALLGYSWWLLEGYQIADSVEYMEGAQAFVRGERILDSTSNRSLGFSTLLLPFFALADWLGVENWQPIVALSRSLQIALALLLVRICVRLGARLAGRRVGLITGFLVGVNPIFLQYGVSPVSGIAAALFVGQALECLIERGNLRRGIRGGLWLGAAMMMAYQTILIIVPVLGLVLLRDRLRRGGLFAGAALGLAAGTLAQIGLDRLTYGQWGASFFRYLADNFIFQAAYFMARIPGLHGLASKIYEATLTLRDSTSTFAGVNVSEARRLLPPDWYLTHLFEMLVWPVILFGVLGLLRSLKQATWKSTLLLVVLLVNVVVMSNKGSKDFRLWIPLLPMLGPICAWGAGLVLGGSDRRPGLVRGLVTAGLLATTMVLSIDTLRARNTRKFSGYWRAMEIVTERAGRERAQNPARAKLIVSSAYHWAVYLRETADVELRKLPHHLDQWDDLSEVARGEVLETLEELDGFLTHLPVLSDHPDLMSFVNETFEVEAMLWESDTFEETGPIFVLRKKTGEPGARTFFEVIEGVDPEAYRRANHLPPAVDFVRRSSDPDGEDRVERVTLLGWQYEELPGDGHGWITFHWYCGSPVTDDYTIVPRLTTFDERNSWQDDHAPAYGVYRMPQWKPGTIVRESRPVVAAAEPYDWRARFRPMGGPYRRGDLMPANLWIDIATFDADGEVTGRMEPARPGADHPVRTGQRVGERRADGFEFSIDDLVRVGRFFLPVHERARVPDDGHPIPE